MRFKKYYNSISCVCVAIVSVILYQGCATGYQSEGITGGFTQKRIAENRFIVTFSGNGYTSAERATDLAGMRCAELAITHGFKYIAFINSETENTVDKVTVSTVSATPYGAVGTSYSIPVLKPNSAVSILCANEVPVRWSGRTYDAKDLFKKYQQKYGVNKVPSCPQLPVNQITAYQTLGGSTVNKNSKEIAKLILKPTAVAIQGFDRSELPRTNYVSFDDATQTVIGWVGDVSQTRYFKDLIDKLIEENHYDNFVYTNQNDADGYAFLLFASYGFNARIGYTFLKKESGVSLETVENVDDNTFAYRDGIRIGDKIRKINSIPIENINDLVIEKKKSFIPGYKVKINLVRNGELKDIEVELVK